MRSPEIQPSQQPLTAPENPALRTEKRALERKKMDIEAQMRRLDEEFELREKSRLERLMKNNTSHLSQISLDLHESATSEQPQPYSPASKLLFRESISRRASVANRPSVSMARGSISRGSIRGRRESVANRLSVAPAQSPDFSL